MLNYVCHGKHAHATDKCCHKFQEFNKLAIVKEVVSSGKLKVEMRDSERVLTWPTRFFTLVAKSGRRYYSATVVRIYLSWCALDCVVVCIL